MRDFIVFTAAFTLAPILTQAIQRALWDLGHAPVSDMLIVSHTKRPGRLAKIVRMITG